MCTCSVIEVFHLLRAYLHCRQWRVDQEELLARKDREAEEQRQEWIAQAQQDLADWEARQAEQLEKTKADNRYVFSLSFILKEGPA